MAARMPESMRLQRYAHYVTNSPLKQSRDDILRAARARKQEHRGAFVLDGVRENVKNSSVIPSYNAFNDRHSQVYFRSPRVQAMLKNTDLFGEAKPRVEPVSLKLSTRQRMPQTPHKDISKREKRFIVDCIRTDTLKTKRKPVIPAYDALDDEHSQGYFRKRSVKELLKRTLNVRL